MISAGPDFTFSSPDDITRVVAAAVVAREETRDEIGTIHVALRNYETIRVPNLLSDLPPHWDVQGATPGAFQDELKGATDAFVAKLSPSLVVEYSTFLGGTDGELTTAHSYACAGQDGAPGESDRSHSLISQAALEKLGYPVGGVDGKIGPNTRSAIKKFQSANNLKADGQPSAALLEKLNAAATALEAPKPEPSGGLNP